MQEIFGFGAVIAVLASLMAFWKLQTTTPSPPGDEETDSTEDSTSAVTPAPSRSTHDPRTPGYEVLSDLPFIFYLLAILCGVVLIGFTIANAAERNSTQMGAWIGYTIGSVLSMLAVGRVIELLQQILDAVRS
jgi:hypothetical protein